MFKIFSIVAALLPVHRPARLDLRHCNDRIRWRRDPLAHPALRSMSQTQLGDLPIGHPIVNEPVGC